MFLARKPTGPAVLTIAARLVYFHGNSAGAAGAVLTDAADIPALSSERASHWIPTVADRTEAGVVVTRGGIHF